MHGPLNAKLVSLNKKNNFFPPRKHPIIVTKTDTLIVFREMIALCCGSRTKPHKHTVCAKCRVSVR
jgi:hypothetical protein